MAKSFKTAKIVKLFLDECKEYLDTLDQDLVTLESGGADEELLKRVSRTLHTIKGSAAMVEFMDISNIAHKMEDALDELKKKLPDIDGELLDQIFTKTDEIKNLVIRIENGTYEEDAEAPGEPAAAKEPPGDKKETTEPDKPAKKREAAGSKEDSAGKPGKKKPGLPEPPGPGRTCLFTIAGEEIKPALERCYAIFSDLEGKYVLADENVDNKDFFNKLFDSISYLQRSLVCYGEPIINEIMNRLLTLREAIKDGKIGRNTETLDAVFKGVSFTKAIMEARMKHQGDDSLPDTRPFIKSVHNLTAPMRDDKDYVSIESANEIFKHLSVGPTLEPFFTPFEKRGVAKELIDSKNIFNIYMKYKIEELSDLASMSEFFKPLTEEGALLTSFVLARGEGSKTEYYDFHLVYTTKFNSSEFGKKYAFLEKIGGVDVSEVELAHADDKKPEEEQETSAPAPGKAGKRAASKGKKADTPRSTVRVDTEKLDVLVNLIAELVINHNKLEQETRRLKQGINTVGDVLDALKFSSKSSGLQDSNITLEDLLRPFKVIQADALELGARRLDSNILEHMKELREARENLVQLFDMELEKETLTNDLLSKMLSLKSEFDGLFHEFQNDALNIGRMIEELQEETMKLRMLPISGVFNKFPRRVRDMAKNLGKNIEFIIEGEDTELDKTLIEEIEEPLLHIIRNAIDHGVEKKEIRRRQGKKDKGKIWARAYHEGNSVVIEVEDDGGGIDTEMIKSKCLDKRLKSHEELDQMAERDILNLIFIPGFSTAEKVTDLSGRGVGMDVVKNSISKLKGTVNLFSDLGQGSVFKLKLPLTLAIIQAMIVKCGEQKFVIPMDPIEHTEQVEKYDVYHIEGKEVYRFQEMVIPLVYLRDIYSLPEETEKKTGSFPVVVLAQAEKKVGIIVDEVVEKQQVVIKTLGNFLGDVKHVSGATIFGDGSIAMILDVAGILQSIPYLSRRSERAKVGGKKGKEQQVLLVDDSLSGRIAQREMLESIGYVVDVASSGMQALSKLADRKFDVIVTDINMPRMDGYEFTRKVRSVPETSRVPIIMVTSDVKSADRNKAFDVGINEFLAKPFSEEDLKQAIEKHTRVF
ncbi:response regulator [bacterium]